MYAPAHPTMLAIMNARAHESALTCANKKIASVELVFIMFHPYL